MAPQSTPVQLPLAETPAEEWRDVPFFEGIYAVSSHGRVKRIAGGHGAKAGRILKARINKYGYPQVALSRGPTVLTRTVHILVASAFIGPIPKGMQCNHLDGHKTHNTPENLEIATGPRNHAHAAELGLKASGDRNGSRIYPERLKRGERNSAAKLTEGAVQEIRILGGTVTNTELGVRYGVSGTLIGYVLQRKIWKHVP